VAIAAVAVVAAVALWLLSCSCVVASGYGLWAWAVYCVAHCGGVADTDTAPQKNELKLAMALDVRGLVGTLGFSAVVICGNDGLRGQRDSKN